MTLGYAKLQDGRIDGADGAGGVDSTHEPPHTIHSNWNKADANLEEITLDDLSEPVEPAPLKRSLIAGCGPLGRNYTPSSIYESAAPVEAVKVALDNGVRAFDNAPHYAPAEAVLGRALNILEPLHPRHTYTLITKVGHYGDEVNYSEARIHESLRRSFAYLNTDYLDIVYLHDVEFVAEAIADINEAGHPTRVLDNLQKYNLTGEPRILGKGDEEVLNALRILNGYKKKGKIRNIGVSALPLPTLLRVSRLAISHLGKDSLQYVMSYANHGPQALAPPSYIQTNFEAFEGLFDDSISLVTASPFAMGLLTPQGPPDWHPAPDGLKDTAKRTVKALGQEASKAAASFSMRKYTTVSGWQNADEVKQGLEAYHDSKASESDLERKLVDAFIKSRWSGYVWSSGRV
ncbi:hypothetical protein E3P91_01287 [Wallemia ichthyophaga]|nr:hypothetical protein E3P91_01287 [Wallemia ichthyophaga]TIB65041.1 hypothetical protein E3P78_00842 [Wallemia ichthyophaga]